MSDREKGPDGAREPERAVRDEVHERPVETPGRTPLWAVRAVAFGLLLTLLAVLAYDVKNRLAPRRAPTASVADQRVVIVALRQVRVRVKVDDAAPVERVLANGDSFEVTGHDRVEVDLPAVEAARVEYNGERIAPQGRQDEPRKLVFVDDVGR